MPYHDRLAIEDGALDGQGLEICWIRDPWDAMSIQIQGSARVVLEDGTTVRLNYDGHNGHPYTPVGRILIERNLVPREEMSTDRIRRWMHDNPDQAKWLRGTNRSFVFFRITGLSNDNEPAGAQGVPLTPGRSIAVDRVHVYGTPFFIEAELPIESARPTTKFRRLMVAQDTGSAIVGPRGGPLFRRRRPAVAGRIQQAAYDADPRPWSNSAPACRPPEVRPHRRWTSKPGVNGSQWHRPRRCSTMTGDTQAGAAGGRGGRWRRDALGAAQAPARAAAERRPRSTRTPPPSAYRRTGAWRADVRAGYAGKIAPSAIPSR